MLELEIQNNEPLDLEAQENETLELETQETNTYVEYNYENIVNDGQFRSIYQVFQ